MTHDTVLLVDDEALLRRLLSRMLIEAGWTVIQADNGQSALEAAREMDGDLGLQVSVLYISGRDLPPSLADSIPEECVLRKPFRTEFFIDAVQRLIVRPA